MFKRPVLVLFSILLTVAIPVGCGDDDDSSADSSGSASLTRADFVKEAEKICVRESDKSIARLGAYVKQRRTSSSDEALRAEAVKAVLLPSVESQIDQIRALGVPSGDEQEVENFLKALEDAVDVAREKPLTPVANAAFSKVNRVGRAYGLERCAYG